MNLREAAQQALEALENSIDIVRHEYTGDWRHGLPTRKAQLDGKKESVDNHENAITALRAALAEREPFQPDWANYRQGVKDGRAEPDAVYWYVGTDGKYYSSHEAELFLDANTKALYKKPPQWRLDKGDLIPLVAYRPRKPLTNEEIEAIRIKEEFDLWGIREGAFKYCARSIEHAHGIKENP